MSSSQTNPAPDSSPLPVGASRGDKIFNFAACLVDATGWPLGIAFFSATTILPVLLHLCHASNLTIGLFTALMNLLVTLPGLLVYRYIARLPRIRAYLFYVALLERFALLPLVWLTPLWGVTHPQWLVIALFAFFCLHRLSMGLNQPSYYALVGKIIPIRWRGRLFGYAGAVGAFLGIGADWLLRHVVFTGTSNGFPDGFSRGFLIGFLVLTVSVLPLAIVREPKQVPPPGTNREDDLSARSNRRGTFGTLWHIWQSDSGFRRLLWSQACAMLAATAVPFFVLHAQQNLHAGGAAVAAYTAIVIVASALGNLAGGAVADHRGNQVVLVGAAVCTTLSLLLGSLPLSPLVFGAVFVLSSLGTAGTALAGNNIALEFAGEAHAMPRYTALYNGVLALPLTLSPLIGGIVADRLGYPTLFLGTLALATLSLMFSVQVHEPRHRDN